jgi:DNA-binding response OmpR family regulator
MNMRKKVLIVDVDEFVLLDLQRILEDAGFDTTVTWDSNEARQMLRNGDFHLLILCDHPPEVVPGELMFQASSRNTLPRCVILRSAGQAGSQPHLSASTSTVCKRNYEEVLRAVQAHLENAPLSRAS